MSVSKEQIVSWLKATADVMSENKTYLTELDSAIGDADHGINMNRGFSKVLEKLPTIEDSDIGNILKTTGMTLISTVGGASGPLYGTFFMRAGMALASKETLSNDDVYTMLNTGMEGVISRGRASVGDKTMIDAMMPAMAAFKNTLDNGGDLLAAMKACVQGAEQGMKDTIPLQAKKGRASYLGERSIGHQDPGATSSFLMLNMLLQALEA
ncbi:MAG: dihydroxyacetone kinase subunit DhaL [Ardenticatenaceae bacterium]|nr:dihydroxyacetone kinase subunit DhaL [Ardenticatenaceae bacterium]